MTITLTLLNRLRAQPSGLGITELVDAHPEIARRSAQRALAHLIKQGQVVAVGAGRSRRYLSRPNSAHTDLPEPELDRFPLYIPVSADSRDILDYIDRPLAARKPVGYQRDFIEDYRPNQTRYLSASLRRQLHNMGKTADSNAPAGTYGRAILNRLLVDFSWASSQLEGNTYSRFDTRELIEHGRVAHGKAVVETQMILNHKSAIERLVDSEAGTVFTCHMLLNLHATLAENLLPNPADEGRLRQHPVYIGKSDYSPLAIPQQVAEAFDLMLTKANQIADPFEQSFFMLVHLPYLQPFADVNKRTSRLAANLPLLRANLCPLTFLDVSEPAYNRAVIAVYEMTRVELLRDVFVWAYERSSQEYLTLTQVLAEPDPLRLAWRDLIKQTIRTVITQPTQDSLSCIKRCVKAQVNVTEQAAVEALIIEELRRLHDGILARYGIRPSEFMVWQAAQQR